ncbi:DUF1190 domain-containing protein [Phenylobacterium sp.]|jgi:uncharacterized protein YgiB involved in biofilm formation|uniref:DUF1190 domain-containing protein n=1 Tax=Phenylobacterium sp. TaxID=1871053 RepID=UPI002F93F909
MKRSRSLALTTLMAAGGLSLTACDSTPDNVRIEQPGQSVDAYAYQSLAECKSKDEVPDAACETAEKAALQDDAKSASWNDQKSCEEVHGEGQCVPRQAANGGHSIWGPLITGFIVGRMLDGGWGGRGYYRDWRSGGYYTASGAPVWRDYSTGRTRVAARGFDAPDTIAPPKAQTRTSVLSRGGFGGRMSNRSYSGGRWGG